MFAIAPTPGMKAPIALPMLPRKLNLIPSQHSCILSSARYIGPNHASPSSTLLMR